MSTYNTYLSAQPMVELIWRSILFTDLPYVQLVYATWLNYHNKVTNKCKGVKGVYNAVTNMSNNNKNILFSTVKLK